MIDIGYLTDPRYDISAICNLEEVEPTRVEQIDAQFIKFCPAVKTLYANTFEIKCPFDLEWTIKFEDDGRFNWELPSDKTTINLEFLKASDILNFQPDGRTVQIAPNPQWSFISDTKNVIMIQHTNGITTNPPIISGQIDIYKWPDRPLSIGYYMNKKSQTFRLRKGQPWFRVSFITPDFQPVRLIRMYERCAFLESTLTKAKLTMIQKLDWKRVFNYFGNSRPKKLIKKI